MHLVLVLVFLESSSIMAALTRRLLSFLRPPSVALYKRLSKSKQWKGSGLFTRSSISNSYFTGLSAAHPTE